MTRTSGNSGARKAGYAWMPTPEQAAATNVMQFARLHGITDYWELVRHSQDDIEWFWDAAASYLEIEFDTPYSQVADLSRGIEWPRWFVDGRLNIAWNAVGRWAGRTPDAVAVVSEDEAGDARSLSYTELWAEVRRVASGLRSLGVVPGDRVALYLPMTLEAAVASHACALLGAIQVPMFSGLAAPAVALRLRDAEAKVMITADVTVRRGAPYPLLSVAEEAARAQPSLEHTVVVSRAGSIQRRSHVLTWDDLRGLGGDDVSAVALPSEHPYYLGYTSGTTGRPKGVIHSTAGFLVKILVEAAFQTDVRPGDTLCWVTDLGWLMGAWAILGANGLGASVLLLEGAPNVPPDRLWHSCARHRVTVLGASPTLVRGLMPHGPTLVERHDLSRLRILASTGEPWDDVSYRWYSEIVGNDRLPIINMSGGTEIGACLLSPTPAIPIKPCSLGAPALGMAVDVVDSEGRPVRGEVGELVCRKPWPAQTRGLWRDPDRYLDSYWRRFPGVWAHGDWAMVDDDGYWFLFGRSDDTLNIAGKRIGPSEIEAALLSHPAVVEAGVVGIPHGLKGETPWCFCVPTESASQDDQLRQELTELVVNTLGASFRPEGIVFVQELPKTRSAKVVRRALRAAVTGAELGDLSGLEDPAVLANLRQAVAAATVP